MWYIIHVNRTEVDEIDVPPDLPGGCGIDRLLASQSELVDEMASKAIAKNSVRVQVS